MSARWTRLLKTAGLAALLLLPAACQQEMAAQPSYKPFDPSSYFSDGRSVRPLAPGTVARGHLRTDIHLFEGTRTRVDRRWARSAAIVGAALHQGFFGAVAAAAAQGDEFANYVDTFPMPVTRDVLQRGHDRFMIFCVVCHDPLGTGHGKIVERGYTQPPTYHSDYLRGAPVGHFYAVMTQGYGSMPDYRQQIPPRDRWAIAAYIRALQLSQHFPTDELTAPMRNQLEQVPKAREAQE
jgi:mono/diheme cytochrome c family protein